MKMQRSAGILLPVSSLPSPYGIGCFSQEAYDFVDWLKEAGQTYWQIQRRKVKDFFIKFTNKLHFAESRCEADA